MFPQNYPFYEFLVHNLSSLQQVTPDSTSFVNCMEQPPQPQGGAGGQPLQPQGGAGGQSRQSEEGSIEPELQFSPNNDTVDEHPRPSRPSPDSRGSRSREEGGFDSDRAAHRDSIERQLRAGLNRATTKDQRDSYKDLLRRNGLGEEISSSELRRIHGALPTPAALQNDGFQTPPPPGGLLPVVDTPLPDQLAVQFASMSTTESNDTGGK